MEESIYGVSVPTPRQFALDLARPSFLEMVLIKVLIFTWGNVLTQQVLNQRALVVRDGVGFDAGYQLASACLALIMLLTAVNMAVFLKLWRSTSGACVSDDHGCCWPPACGGVFDQQ
jgi:hypothetical protein